MNAPRSQHPAITPLLGPSDGSPGAADAGTTAAIPRLLTIGEVAAILRMHQRTIRRLVAYRRLPCVRIGRQLRFVPSDIVRWVSARKEG
jgi:excisionase family DNA binding protein